MITTKNRIVLCGSMSQYSKMQSLREYLSDSNTEVIIPPTENQTENICISKKEYSLNHFKEVTNDKTTAILVVNCPKNGIYNYIGANTFAEIAFAFFYEKKIFILEDIYHSYRDELISWEAITLKGNVNSIHCYLNDKYYSNKRERIFD